MQLFIINIFEKKHHNFNEQLINIFSSHVNIADILFSINRFIKQVYDRVNLL